MEVYGIAGNSDSKVRIFFGMLNCVKKHLTVKYVYVDMLSLLTEISVDNGAEVSISVLIIAAESGGNYTEGIGDTVLAHVVGKLSHGVERSECAAGISTVHGVSAGGEGLAKASSVGSITGFLTVNDV